MAVFVGGGGGTCCEGIKLGNGAWWGVGPVLFDGKIVPVLPKRSRTVSMGVVKPVGPNPMKPDPEPMDPDGKRPSPLTTPPAIPTPAGPGKPFMPPPNVVGLLDGEPLSLGKLKAE